MQKNVLLSLKKFKNTSSAQLCNRVTSRDRRGSPDLHRGSPDPTGRIFFTVKHFFTRACPEKEHFDEDAVWKKVFFFLNNILYQFIRELSFYLMNVDTHHFFIFSIFQSWALGANGLRMQAVRFSSPRVLPKSCQFQSCNKKCHFCRLFSKLTGSAQY